MGDKGSDVNYTPPPPTQAEKELQAILVGEARQRNQRSQLLRELLYGSPTEADLTPEELARLDSAEANAPGSTIPGGLAASRAGTRNRELQQLLNERRLAHFKEFMNLDLTPEEQDRLGNITNIYTKTRTTPLYEQADIAERNLRQRFASQGILDSSVAADAQVDLQKELSKRISEVGEQAALFRYGTEEDLRRAALANKLQQVGILQQGSDPSVAYNTLSALTGQRTQEANQALQIALHNAQSGGGFMDLLTQGAALGLGWAVGGPVGGYFGAKMAGGGGGGSKVTGSAYGDYPTTTTGFA